MINMEKGYDHQMRAEATPRNSSLTEAVKTKLHNKLHQSYSSRMFENNSKWLFLQPKSIGKRFYVKLYPLTGI